MTFKKLLKNLCRRRFVRFLMFWLKARSWLIVIRPYNGEFIHDDC